MFTGIIDSIGTIEASEQKGDLALWIACDYADLALGESIAVSGVCLTVVEIFPLPLRERVRGRGGCDISSAERMALPPTLPSPSRGGGFAFAADVSAETLKRTAPRWSTGDKVNLERSLTLGDRLGGHLVSGHVDGLATIAAITGEGDSHILALEAPPALMHFIAEKGSVTLDGVSLTVNKVEGARFFVNIIPHTWAGTTLGARKKGESLNLEIDTVARYIERLMQK